MIRCKGDDAKENFELKAFKVSGSSHGLEQNDPGNFAMEEVAALFPYHEGPSLVVSLGTGSARLEKLSGVSHARGLLQDGFIPRLFRAFKRSIGGSQPHRLRSLQRKGNREQYFRIDTEFDGPEPELDNTTKVEELKEAARAAIVGSKELVRLPRFIVSELFIFQLVEVPCRRSHLYTGKIVCRLRANTNRFRKLMSQMKNNSSKFLLQGHMLSGSIKDDSYFSKDGNFCKRITFEVLDKDSPFSVQLQRGSLEPTSISGSPFTIHGLITAQKLGSCFGRADHVKRKRKYSIDSAPRKRQRT